MSAGDHFPLKLTFQADSSSLLGIDSSRSMRYGHQPSLTRVPKARASAKPQSTPSPLSMAFLRPSNTLLIPLWGLNPSGRVLIELPTYTHKWTFNREKQTLTFMGLDAVLTSLLYMTVTAQTQRRGQQIFLEHDG